MAVIVTYATLVQVHGFQSTWVGSPRWTTDIRHISPMTGVPHTSLEQITRELSTAAALLYALLSQLSDPPYGPGGLDKYSILLRNKVVRCR
jgi:hypothetical protein